jgi:hypothetical protein
MLDENGKPEHPHGRIEWKLLRENGYSSAP